MHPNSATLFKACPGSPPRPPPLACFHPLWTGKVPSAGRAQSTLRVMSAGGFGEAPEE